jgi:hypothetical protein
MEKLWFIIGIRIKEKRNGNCTNGKRSSLIRKLIETIIRTRKLIENPASPNNRKNERNALRSYYI